MRSRSKTSQTGQHAPPQDVRRTLRRHRRHSCDRRETDAEHGRALLKQACYALRRDLHARDLFLGSIQLRLNPAVVSSDVESFAAALEENDLTRAVSLYTAFLDGFYLNGGGEFENWAEIKRARLAGQCRAALEVLATEATTRGEHRVAADWWRRLLELEPLSSHAALGLMTALDHAGERAAALRCGEGGRIAESLGERPKAIDSYQFVVDVWRHADPKLAPYVREARTALERLAGER